VYREALSRYRPRSDIHLAVLAEYTAVAKRRSESRPAMARRERVELPSFVEPVRVDADELAAAIDHLRAQAVLN